MLVMRVALLGLLLGPLACQQMTNPPVVSQQTFSHAAGSTRVVAVMPFAVAPGAVRDPEEAGVSDREVADLVAAFVAEALSAEGVAVIPPSDMATFFLNQNRAVPRLDPQRAALVAAREFGATSVVMGEVIRWRKRTGEAFGAGQPASVAFVMHLDDAPGGRRLWTSRFDHTQRTITADPLIARKYPGGGTRFLTAQELARWGVRSAVSTLLEGQWRASN